VPRKPEWIEQLPFALKEVRLFPAPVIDRAILEKVLRIERRTAIRILNRFGGFQSGKTFLIGREKLIAKLEETARGDDATAERDRRARLADELEKTRRLAPRAARSGSTPPPMYATAFSQTCRRVFI
jgi:hypothetical protein